MYEVKNEGSSRREADVHRYIRRKTRNERKEGGKENDTREVARANLGILPVAAKVSPGDL